MRNYAGRSVKDPPLGGGGFPLSHGYCGEECNFVPCDDGPGATIADYIRVQCGTQRRPVPGVASS
ncbi:hypothetical protein CIT26_26065 [Mesorhizobium temperatum]|uniref:Uncharacterized protein n=1 Tax=Mesorhizobium temperatum TaxID=241416 RepID=A0A271LEQ6_9HYPH|nr:hypothetical protein CIT26_26065 [Mesorhizobium temperatum]